MADDQAKGGEASEPSRRRLGPELQVLAGLGSLVALLAGAVAVAVFLIVGLEDNTTDLSRRHVEYATSIQEAALSAKAIANFERGLLLSGNPEFLEQLDERTDEARRAFTRADSYAAGAPERDAAREAHAGFEQWLRAVQGEIAAYRAGSRERAIATSLGPTRELRKSYEQSLARAYSLGVGSIESATRSVSASARRSVTILLVYLAFALVIGVGVAVWVVRTILKPAYALSRNAMEVLTRGRVIVEEDARGSHYGVVVEVPIEVVNALADSALEAQEVLRTRNDPTTS